MTEPLDKIKQLPPGSIEAFIAGCKCPHMDNAYGRGRGKNERGETIYVQREDCPLHGWGKNGND